MLRSLRCDRRIPQQPFSGRGVLPTRNIRPKCRVDPADPHCDMSAHADDARQPQAFSNPAPGVRPSPEATYAAVDRLIGLVQDIDHLLGDSMHSLTQASVMMARHASVLGSGPGAEVLRQLREASDKLEKVSELVHAALQGRAVPLGSPLLSRARPITLREAIEHAAEVLSPMIRSSNTRVRLQVPDDIGASPAGTMYTVVLNGLQNAIESIQRRSGEGHITVTVRPDTAPARATYGKDARPWYCLEIIDDGVGPPTLHNSDRVFDLGYSTKSRGAGVGLAVARSVIQSMGGTIELFPNLDKAPSGTKGAVLRARFPSPDAAANIRIGGAA